MKALFLHATIFGSFIGSLDIFGLDTLAKYGPSLIALGVVYFLLTTRWANDSGIHTLKKTATYAFALGFCMAFGSGIVSFSVGLATGFTEVMMSKIV